MGSYCTITSGSSLPHLHAAKVPDIVFMVFVFMHDVKLGWFGGFEMASKILNPKPPKPPKPFLRFAPRMV